MSTKKLERAQAAIEAAKAEQAAFHLKRQILETALKEKAAAIALSMKRSKRREIKNERTIADHNRKLVVGGLIAFGAWCWKQFPDQIDVALLDEAREDKKAALHNLKVRAKAGDLIDG